MTWLSLGISLIAVVVSVVTFLLNRRDTKLFREEDRLNQFRVQAAEIWQLGVTRVSDCVDLGTRLSVYFGLDDIAGAAIASNRERFEAMADSLHLAARDFYALSVRVPRPLGAAIYAFQESATELSGYVKALNRAVEFLESRGVEVTTLDQIEQAFASLPDTGEEPRTWAMLAGGELARHNHDAYREMMLVAQAYAGER